jgi:hypothetical protein
VNLISPLNCVTIVLVLVWCAMTLPAQGAGAKVITYPAPEGAPPASRYQVSVNGSAIFVYDARIDNPRNNAFAAFDFAGSVQVMVTVPEGFTSVTLRPRSAGIRPTVKGHTIAFQLTKPVKLSLELNGSTQYPLFLFANPLEVDPPTPATPGLRYFGPGIHTVGKVELHDQETVYVAGGAIVRGYFEAKDAKHVTIRGRGILDAHENNTTMIKMTDCSDALVEGVTIVDQPTMRWTTSYWSCDNLRIENVKIMAGDGWSNDGIDICSCHNATIHDCFVKVHDDCIVVKALGTNRREVRDITITGCLLWNTWAHAINIGPELDTPIVTNITVRNCDIIHPYEYGAWEANPEYLYYGALGIVNGDDGVVSHVRFEDIRIEDLEKTTPRLVNLRVQKTEWNHTKGLGAIRNVVFKDIQVLDSVVPIYNYVHGADADHLIEDVTFDNLIVHGKLITSAEIGHFDCNAAVKNMRFTGDTQALKQRAVPVRTALQIVTPFPISSGSSRGSVRLTVTNADQTATAAGTIRLGVKLRHVKNLGIDPSPTFLNGTDFRFALQPGHSATKDFDITVDCGNYTVFTLPTYVGMQLSELPLTVEAPLKRMTAMATVDGVEPALATAPVFTVKDGDRVAAHLRWALAGNDLAISAQVYDAHLTRGKDPWSGSEVEIYGSMPGAEKLGQIFLLPQVGEAPAQAYRLVSEGVTRLAPEIRVQSQASAEGYHLQALVPLSLLTIDPAAEHILLESMVMTTPAPKAPLQGICLFRSYMAYKDTLMYGHLRVQ